MRSLHVTAEAGGTDGLSAATLGLCRQLGAMGYRSQLVTVGERELATSTGFDHASVAEARWLPHGARAPGIGAVLEEKALSSDVIHVHGLWRFPGLEAVRVAKGLGMPFIVSVHGMLSPEALRISRWQKRIFWRTHQRAALAGASLVHATSEREYEAIRASGIEAPVAIVPFGVDLWPPGITTPNRGRTVLFLGRLHPIKGLDLLLDAWHTVKRNGFRDWRLRIVGPEGVSGYRRELERVVHRRTIPDVEFGAEVTGDAKWMELGTAALTVLPSRSENFGLTVVESLVAATPVIVTDRAPWSELPAVGAGWYVNCEAGSIALALGQGMSLDAADRQAMGERGRAWVTNRFSWTAAATEMAHAYAWLLSRAAPPEFVRLGATHRSR